MGTASHFKTSIPIFLFSICLILSLLRTETEFGDAKNILVVNDEAHHCWRFSEKDEDDEKDVDEDIDLEEVIAALSEEEKEDDEKNEVASLKSDLDEHRNVVKYLRSKLNEVHLYFLELSESEGCDAFRYNLRNRSTIGLGQ